MATEVKPGETGKTGDPAAPTAAAKASEGVMISASELTTLREQAAQAPIAMADAKRANTALRLMSANDAIDLAKRAGRLVPAEEDFWRDELVTANDERFEKLKKHLADKPVVVGLGAIGSGEATEVDESKWLDAAARKYMSEHKDATYKDALLNVAKEGK